jgi:hypothetical protein
MAFTAPHKSEQWLVENCVYALDVAEGFGLVDADVTGSATAAALVTTMKALIDHQSDEPLKLYFDIFNTAKSAGVFADSDIAAATGISDLRNSIADLHEQGTLFRDRTASPQIHP